MKGTATMTPMSYSQWSATEDRREDIATLRRRYEAYLSAMAFIRSQCGALPAAGSSLATVESRHSVSLV